MYLVLLVNSILFKSDLAIESKEILSKHLDCMVKFVSGHKVVFCLSKKYVYKTEIRNKDIYSFIFLDIYNSRKYIINLLHIKWHEKEIIYCYMLG